VKWDFRLSSCFWYWKAWFTTLICLLQLNEVLVPNPFDRPHAVFMLEVRGTDPKLMVNLDNAMLSSASKRKVSFGLEKAADIQLPGT
jgi:hypothetical protein